MPERSNRIPLKMKKGTIVVPLCSDSVLNPLADMKTVSKNSNSDILSNPINRNLILILVTALVVSIVVVTTSIIVYYQL